MAAAATSSTTPISGKFWVNDNPSDFSIPYVASIFTLADQIHQVNKVNWSEGLNKLEMVLTGKLKERKEFIFVMFVFFVAQTQIVHKQKDESQGWKAIQMHINTVLSILTAYLEG